MDQTHIVVVDRHARTIYQTRHIPSKIMVHSTAKLMQALPVYLLHLDEKYNLSSQELAILSSSHLGQPQHMKVLQALLQKADIDENDLVLPPVAPAGRIAFQNWKNAGKCKWKLFHPCVGNHIAMLLAQRALTGSASGYEKYSSKVQRMIKALFAELCQCPIALIGSARDFCGVPTFCVSPVNVAIAYKNFASPSVNFPGELSTAIRKNNIALKSNPLMLEGDGCLSTIITSYHGLIAKTGTHGLLAIAEENHGYGIVIKSDAGNWEDIARVSERVLYRLGYQNSSLSLALQSI